jgi:plastocyanin
MNRYISRLAALGLLAVALAAPLAAQTMHVVNISGTTFSPAILNIEAGDTVKWMNNEGLHNVNGTAASYPGNPEGFGNDVAPAPWVYMHTFDTPGTYNYHCDVHGAPGVGMRGRINVAPAPGTGAAPLFISEYVEGSLFNKAIEIYNATDAAIDFGVMDVTLEIYYNGNTTRGDVIALTGTVAPGDVYVIAEDSADPAILAVADQTSGSLSFNGDDAILLVKGAMMILDSIGQVGFDPGTEWGAGDTSTADNTLRREGDSCEADTDTSDAFDPAVHYVGYPINAFDGLGNANLTCEAGGVVVDIEPVNGPIVLPPGGGSFSYTASIENTTTSQIHFCTWVAAALPNGTDYGPITPIRALTLDPGESVGRTLNARVPGAAPAGTYTVSLNVGTLQSIAYSDSFTFEKLPPVAGRVAEVPFTEAPIVSEGAFFTSAVSASPVATVGVYPNPVRGQGTFRFVTEAAAPVRLAVYDALGREVAVLVDASLDAGAHTAAFDASALPSGVYVYRLTVGGQAQSGRLTLVR